MRRRSARRSRPPRSPSTRSTSCGSASAPSTRSAATNGTPTSVRTPQAAAGSRAPAGRCSRRRQADDRPARAARRGPTGQQGALPCLPAQGRAQAALPARRPTPRARAPRRLAGLGLALAADTVHQARAHDPSPPPRHPRRDPPRPHQRPPRRPQQPHPPDQPPQLRLSLRRPPDRPRLPLLRRHHHRPAAMNFTTERPGAPNFVFNQRGSSPFPYYRESVHGTIVTTNLETGGTFTNVFASSNRDHTIVDNGD